MARIIGSVNTSHVPAIGRAIADNKENDPYWKPFFHGFDAVRNWVNQEKPDVVVMFHNDHGLNFFLDKMPSFAIGAADTYNNADEGWGIPTLASIRGCVDLSWQIVETLVHNEFDITTCQEELVDHGVTMPLALLWPEHRKSGDWPVQVVPIFINTVLAPYPSATRCYKLGQTVRQAIESWDNDAKVLIIGSGGLSHQLDGERAGFINKKFDQAFMQSLIDNPRWATQFTNEELVERVGTQGIEMLMWVAARGALEGMAVEKLHSHYHAPISNTAGGVLVLKASALKQAGQTRAAAAATA